MHNNKPKCKHNTVISHLPQDQLSLYYYAVSDVFEGILLKILFFRKDISCLCKDVELIIQIGYGILYYPNSNINTYSLHYFQIVVDAHYSKYDLQFVIPGGGRGVLKIFFGRDVPRGK